MTKVSPHRSGGASASPAPSRSSPDGTTPLGRTRFVLLVLGLCLPPAILVWHLMSLQVTDRPFLQSQGDARTLRHEVVPAHRGMISDRHGNPLAISSPVVTLWANPQDLPNDPIQHALLAQALGFSPQVLSDRITRYRDREFMYLRRLMTPEAAQSVLDLEIDGVHSTPEYKRFYPSGEISAQLVGVTNIDDVGQEGLELAYDHHLTGVNGQRRILQDSKGRLVRELELIKDADPGGELILSIDQRLQYSAYRELRSAVLEHQADGGVVVMMDSRSGEVLAMANFPSYNPNDRSQLDPRGLRNQAMVDVFEPGSVVKPLAMAALLDSGQVNPDRRVQTSPGSIMIDGFTIRDIRDYGTLDLSGILEKSSNVGMSKLALSLPGSPIREQYHQLGFGQSPGTGFPGESAGNLPAPVRWSRSERAAMAYGYGFSVSALQLASAYSAIANQGARVSPSLLKRPENPHGKVQAMAPETANRLLDMLETAVGPSTGGRRARVAGYRVAGKTGTVRKIGAAGYQDVASENAQAYRSVFAGIAPVSDPRVVTVVMIDHPRAGEFYGGAVAAPVFSSVTGTALRLLDVPPDRQTSEETP